MPPSSAKQDDVSDLRHWFSADGGSLGTTRPTERVVAMRLPSVS